MIKNKVFKLNNNALENAKIINANLPNLVVFSTKYNGELADVLVNVEQEVKIGQNLAVDKNTGKKIVSTVNGSIKAIEEKQNKDGSYSLNIFIVNNFKKAPVLNKLVKPTVSQLNKRIEKANIYELASTNFNNLSVVINTLDNKKTFGLNNKILNTYLSQILKGANLIKKALNKKQIFIAVSKENYLNVQNQITKLNLKGVSVVKKAKVKGKVSILNIQTPLDFYEAVSNGKIATERFIAVGGLSIKNANYYLVKIGTPLNELMKLCGGLKHSYEEIDNYKEQALLAVNDEVMIKQDIKNKKSAEEKQKLKKLLADKKQEAKNTVFKYLKENHNKYKLCLSNMVFVNNKKIYSAKTIENFVDENTLAVLFLSNIEYKHKRKLKNKQKNNT